MNLYYIRSVTLPFSQVYFIHAKKIQSSRKVRFVGGFQSKSLQRKYCKVVAINLLALHNKFNCTEQYSNAAPRRYVLIFTLGTMAKHNKYSEILQKKKATCHLRRKSQNRQKNSCRRARVTSGHGQTPKNRLVSFYSMTTTCGLFF